MRTIICDKKEQKLTPRYKAFVSLKEDLEIVKSLLRYCGLTFKMALFCQITWRKMALKPVWKQNDGFWLLPH